jgi:hypothetical protein
MEKSALDLGGLEPKTFCMEGQWHIPRSKSPHIGLHIHIKTNFRLLNACIITHEQ